LQACDAAHRSNWGGTTGTCEFTLEKVERIPGVGECGEGVAYGEEGDGGRGVVIHGEAPFCDRGDRGDLCVCTHVADDDFVYLCILLGFDDRDGGNTGSTSGAVMCVFSDACEFVQELERPNEGGDADED